MNVDIYLTEKGGKREIRFPYLPEEIQCKGGDTIFVSYDIMGKGETAVPSGVELSGYSWSGEFPGKYQSDASRLRGSWKDPSTYHNTLMDWQQKGTLLNLLVTGYPINADVYIESYHHKATGAFGDVSYEITLKGGRSIAVVSTSTTTAQSSTPKRTTTAPRTHTIKPGDTLWAIAQANLGSGARWEEIYRLNSKIIEQTAEKYGKSSSNKGWWIYPGVTLKLPQ